MALAFVDTAWISPGSHRSSPRSHDALGLSGQLQHIRTVTRDYADRYGRIVEGLERQLAPWLRVVPSAAGMHLAATVNADVAVDIAHVVARAAARGVAVRSLADFAIGAPARAGLVLGYGGIAGARIDEGLTRLAAAFTAVAR